MAFTGSQILIIWVVKITLPDYTIRLSDGGFVDFLGERYFSSDEFFGTIDSVDKAADGASDSAPGLLLTFLPKDAGSAGKLSSPGMQNSPIEVWQLDVDQATNIVTGSELEFSGMLDNTKLMGAFRERRLEMGVISEADWLFSRDEANTLSDRFHQQHNPGELGLSNVTGVTTAVAWGVANAARSSGNAGRDAVYSAINRVLS